MGVTDGGDEVFVDDFDRGLDHAVWMPHYLPHWSSRDASAAAWAVHDSALRLSIPTDHPLWCPRTHDTPLKVSGVQSGVFSGPVDSPRGQQPFTDGLTVQEEQGLWTGRAVTGGLVEVRARMELSARSMASVWMIGVEDEPDRSGEICVFEVFGDSVTDDSAAVGSGIHPFRDPALSDDFEALRTPIDVRDWHVYGADWRDDHVDLLVDGRVTRTVRQSPAYPLHLVMAVFDFPGRAEAGGDAHVPQLDIDWVRNTSTLA